MSFDVTQLKKSLEGLDENQDGAENMEKETPCHSLVWANEMKPSLDVGDFVENLLTEGGFSVLYGPSNVGKSFFAFDLASRVASSTAFAGREVEGGAVLYIALEGSHGAKNRVAVLKKKGRNLDNLSFTFSPVSLYEETASAFVEANLDEIEKQTGKSLKLVVIDTLSRAMAGGDENSPADMTGAIQNIERIKQATNAHVMVVHHSGKDVSKGARGHSSLRAAADTELEIEKIDEKKVERASLVQVTKQRDLDCSEHIPFQLEVEELGKNKRGSSVTSCVVKYLNPSDFSDTKGGRVKHEPEDLLQLLPCNATQWQERSKSELGITKNQFYVLKKQLEDSKRVRCEPDGKERIFHEVTKLEALFKRKPKKVQNTKKKFNFRK